MWEPLELILRNRLNLDLIPDATRNAVYSPLPTITTLIGIPGALIGGYYFTNFGFVQTILFTCLLSGLGLVIAGIGLGWLSKISKKDEDGTKI